MLYVSPEVYCDNLDVMMINSLKADVFQSQSTQEVWEKFEVLENVPINEFFPMPPVFPAFKYEYIDPILEMLDKEYYPTLYDNPKEIVNHDCMWAGHCLSKDHESPLVRMKRQNSCPQPSTVVAPAVRRNPNSSRSLLINSKNNQQMKNNIRHDHSFSKDAKVTKITGASSANNSTTFLNSAVTVQHYETPEGSSEDDSMDCNPQLQQIVDYITSEKQTVMQILNEALSAADMPDQDADLCDYLRGNLEMENCEKKQNHGDEESSSELSSGSEISESESDDGEEYIPPAPPTPVKKSNKKKKSVKNNDANAVVITSVMPDHAYHRTAESDHCYHISKEPAERFENLGVDTPSDSEEEEIDVVNVYGSETHHQMLRNYHQKTPLPTNPSNYDRQSLQKSVETAINKRSKRTIKTRLPKNKNTKTVPTSQNSNYNTEEYTITTDGHNYQQSTVTNHSSNNTNCHTVSYIEDHSTISHSTPPATPQQPKTRSNKKRGATEPAQKGNNKGAKKARRSYRQRRKRGSDSSDSDSDKRNLHNDMERQRRVDLRRAFDGLRALLPTVCDKDRAAKVNILREAETYCRNVNKLEIHLRQTKLELKRHQDSLMARVSYMRRMLASKR